MLLCKLHKGGITLLLGFHQRQSAQRLHLVGKILQRTDVSCDTSKLNLASIMLVSLRYLTRPCVYIEMACNSVFGAGDNGVINPPKLDRTFRLEQVELIIQDEDVFQLICDFEVLIGLAKVRVHFCEYCCYFGLLRIVCGVNVASARRKQPVLSSTLHSKRNGECDLGWR